MKLMKVLLTLLTVLAAAVYGSILISERFYTDKEPPVISFDSDTITVSVKAAFENEGDEAAELPASVTVMLRAVCGFASTLV